MSRSREQAAAPSQTEAHRAAEQQGVDATLLAALATGSPVALAAAAGLVDNSLIAAAMGRDSGRDDTRVATTDRTAARGDEADRGRDGATESLESRGLPQGETTEGSGEHGRLDPGAVDYANHSFWRGVAAGAEGAGLTNAARHMNHFLDNSGADLELDLDDLEASNTLFAANVEDAHAAAIEDALYTMDGADSSQGGAWDTEARFQGADSYFNRGVSDDWYFAVGGNTHYMTTRVTYTPDSDGSGSGQLDCVGAWTFYDRYNWDGGKQVNIMGVTVNDEVLGRLHVVGLAKEYDVRGSREDRFSARLEGQTPAEGADETGSGGGREAEPRTGRDDVARERR